MKPIITVFFVLTLFLTAHQASADWIKTTVDENGSEFYYDPSTIHYKAKDVVRVWEKQITDFFEMKALIEYNCTEKKFRPINLSKTYFDPNIDTCQYSSESSSWVCPSQGSIAYESMKNICTLTTLSKLGW